MRRHSLPASYLEPAILEDAAMLEPTIAASTTRIHLQNNPAKQSGALGNAPPERSAAMFF
jgi:hypothetical protein